MTRALSRPVLVAGITIGLFIPSQAVRALAAQAAGGDDWVYLGVVAETGGAPAKWLGETGFVYADAANKTKVAPAVGDRLQLTTVKSIMRTNAQGQKPYEHPAAYSDAKGEFAVGTVLKVFEIGKRPTSKAGDRWECWVRVQR